MTNFEEEPQIITTDREEVEAIHNSLYVMGSLDDIDIYRITRPDGTTEQLQLGGDFKSIADYFIQEAYPGCTATLLSLGDQTG